ncbi:MAG: hypothetical protein ACREOJ_06770, partial [Gemmatimonadaceae bacterium]
MTSRRDFVERAALATLGLALPARDTHSSAPVPTARPSAGNFLDLHRPPDVVIAQTADDPRALRRAPDDRWMSADGIVVTTTPHADALHVALAAPAMAIRRIYLRWHGDLAGAPLILGDAWERAYGDLEWRTWNPDRVMPWYFAASDGARTHAYGVRTGPSAFCYWQVDPRGMSLCADVRSGGVAVELGSRALDVCDVACRAGREGESAFAAIHAFCRQMCPGPRLAPAPVYGSNDWYWAYGNNSAV